MAPGFRLLFASIYLPHAPLVFLTLRNIGIKRSVHHGYVDCECAAGEGSHMGDHGKGSSDACVMCKKNKAFGVPHAITQMWWAYALGYATHD